VELTPQEIRVLGCLVEKETTTPDTYPLSTNGLLLACNQRSSRDPVVAYDEDEVTRALVSLRERELVRTAREGGRVYKHAHLLRQRLGIDEGELAVLSVLFLRGAQTSGELRTRSERQHFFASVDEVEQVLGRLSRNEPPLTAQLERRPGQKESRWAHLLGGDEPTPAPSPPADASLVLANTSASAADLAAGQSAAATLDEPAALRDEPAALRDEPAALRDEPAALRDEIAALRKELAELRDRVDTLEGLL
jgi:uncharacterized protein